MHGSKVVGIKTAAEIFGGRVILYAPRHASVFHTPTKQTLGNNLLRKWKPSDFDWTFSSPF